MGNHWLETPLKLKPLVSSEDINSVIEDLKNDKILIENINRSSNSYFRTLIPGSSSRYKIISPRLKNLRECLIYLSGFKMGFAWGKQRIFFNKFQKESSIFNIPAINLAVERIFESDYKISVKCKNYNFLFCSKYEINNGNNNIWYILDCTENIISLKFATIGPKHWSFFKFLSEAYKFDILNKEDIKECLEYYFNKKIPFKVKDNKLYGKASVVNPASGIMYTGSLIREKEITRNLPEYLEGLI